MPAKSPAADEKGMKRICPSCGTRYYDLGKRPVICPNCTTEFTGELKIKSRRGRVAAVPEEEEAAPEAANKEQPADTEEAETDADTVSLEEVESLEDGDDDEEDVLDADLDEDDLADDDDEEEEIAVEDDKDI